MNLLAVWRQVYQRLSLFSPRTRKTPPLTRTTGRKWRRLETLEPRIALAADVTVITRGGDLTIFGTPEDDAIAVEIQTDDSGDQFVAVTGFGGNHAQSRPDPSPRL